MKTMIAISLFVAGVCAGSAQAATGLLGIGFETQDDSWRGVTAGVAGTRKEPRDAEFVAKIKMMVEVAVPYGGVRLDSERRGIALDDVNKGVIYVDRQVRELMRTYRGDVPTGGKQVVVFTGITWSSLRTDREKEGIQYWRMATIKTRRIRIIPGDRSPLSKWPEHRYVESPEEDAWREVRSCFHDRKHGAARMVVWSGGTEPLVTVTY